MSKQNKKMQNGGVECGKTVDADVKIGDKEFKAIITPVCPPANAAPNAPANAPANANAKQGGGKKKPQQKVLYKKHPQHKPSRSSIVYLDASSKKYIKINGEHIYLNTIRGKYRYVDE